MGFSKGFQIFAAQEKSSDFRFQIFDLAANEGIRNADFRFQIFDLTAKEGIRNADFRFAI